MEHAVGPAENFIAAMGLTATGVSVVTTDGRAFRRVASH